jgi:hypothetical protein
MCIKSGDGLRLLFIIQNSHLSFTSRLNSGRVPKHAQTLFDKSVKMPKILMPVNICKTTQNQRQEVNPV